MNPQPDLLHSRARIADLEAVRLWREADVDPRFTKAEFEKLRMLGRVLAGRLMLRAGETEQGKAA